MKLLRWLVLLYIGQPGGPTRFWNVRPVFYSNSGAPIAQEMIKDASTLIGNELRALQEDKKVQAAVSNAHIARRFEVLLDAVT